MCQPEEISEKLTQAELHPIEPKLVSGGPVQEEIHVGDQLLEHGGLEEFPIPVTTPGWDAAPYISAGQWVTKDPETGIPNIGMYRAMVKSPTLTGIAWEATQGALFHWRKCKQIGTPLEAAIMIGGPPSIGYVSIAKFPVGVNEFTMAGGIAGEPVEVVKCKTVNLEVPAAAEIVIEGEISTTEVEPEGPFGEALGFMGQVAMHRLFRIKCITHRKQPIWLATLAQYAPNEGSKLTQHAHGSRVLHYLRHDQNMQQVLDVACFDSLVGALFTVIKVKKTEVDEVWHILKTAANHFLMPKAIIAVDEDVNLRDLDSVMLAVCVRTQPHRDFLIVKLPTGQVIEAETVERSQVLIDATMEQPYPPLSLPKKEYMDEALRIWQEEGLPQLKLTQPWWGINLGAWSEEEEELARAAVEGNYYKAGELYAQKRRPA
jgi:4-hydroxy-3-polyprenylbenzoate decarboxylase